MREMSAHWTDRLSDYVDGELSPGEARLLEAHVAGCGECATTLRELRAVVAGAAALPDEPPARDLWPAIEARLAPRTAEGVDRSIVPLAPRRRPAGRRIAMTVPQLIAAGIALVVLSSGGAWLALRGTAESAPAPVAAVQPQGAVQFTSSWEAAVAELEAEFEARRPQLDPATILVVERNLAIIDEAIAQAQQALEADPASGFLNGYVAEAMRRKVDLLRQATRIQRTES